MVQYIMKGNSTYDVTTPQDPKTGAWWDKVTQKFDLNAPDPKGYQSASGDNSGSTLYFNADGTSSTTPPAAPPPVGTGGPADNSGLIGTGVTSSGEGGPITNQQLQNLYNMPDQAGQAAAVQGAQDRSNQAAPQTGASPLAGLTTLGKMNNAGVATAGPTQINTGTSNAITAGQISNINQLAATARGEGPSVAEQQAKMAAERNVSNEMALVGSQRGASNPALGIRAAQDAIAGDKQNAVQQAVMGRTQEEMAAQAQLAGALGTTQGQVQQGAQAQAGLSAQQIAANQQAMNAMNAQNVTQQNAATSQQGTMAQGVQLANAGTAEQSALANLGARGTTQALNTNEYNAALQARMALANNQLTANENYGGLVTGENTQLQGIASGQAIANNANNLGLIGAGIAGASALGAAGIDALSKSDRKDKINIKSGKRDMKDFLSKIGSVISSKSTFNLMEAI